MAPINATILGALIVCVIASITDIRTGKIYNKLTLPAVLIGLIVRACQFGFAATDTHLAAAVAGFIQGILGCILGGLSLGIFKMTIMRKLGGGDVKLMMALGAFVGPGIIIATFIYYCVFFGVYGCSVMLLAFPWQQAVTAYAAKNKALINLEHFNKVRKAPLPVAPFILGGLLVSIVFYKQTGAFFGLQ